MTTTPKNKDAKAGAPQGSANADAAKKRPVKVFTVEDVSVPIFEHRHELNGVTKVNYSWTVQRSYKSDDGQWKRTPWLGQDDCGKGVTALQQAAEWMHDQPQPDVTPAA